MVQIRERIGIEFISIFEPSPRSRAFDRCGALATMAAARALNAGTVG